jgi:toxin ParE1/3/4
VTSDFLAPSAEADLYEAVTWLARRDKAAADALREAALHSMRRIVERPLVGRLRPELAPPPYRFWRIATFPYLIVYNAERTPPLVLRVLHMSRDLPPLLAGLADLPEQEPPKS